MPTTWVITIGGVNVTDTVHFNKRKVARGSLSVSQAVNGRRAGQLTIHSEDGSYTPATRAEVVITRDGFKLYGGSIWSRRKIIRAGTDLISWDLTLVDYNSIADRRVSGERSWFDQPVGVIVRDIVTNDLTAEDVTATGVADGPTIAGEYRLVGFPSVADALSDLAKRTESQWYIDKNKDLRFFQQSTAGYTPTFEITKDNAYEIVPTESQEEYANKVKLKLAQYLMPEDSETFNKDHASYPVDGERKEFAVPYPIASAPKVEVNDVVVEVGNSDNEADVAKPWFWSAGSQFIVQNAANLALGRVDEDTLQSPITDRIKVTYIGVGQLTVDATNDDEVAACAAVEGGSGFHIRVVDIADQTSLQKANELAASILGSLDELPTSITYRTNTLLEPACDTLKPGDRQMVEGTEYIVRSVKWQDEPKGDVLWLEAEVVRGPMLQDLPGLLKDLATGGNTLPTAAPVSDSTTVDVPATEGDNLIANASFEALRTGWTTSTEIESRTSVESTGSAHGTHHLKVTHGVDTGSIYTDPIAVSEALPLIFEGQYKRTSVTATDLYVTARFYDGAGADAGSALDVAIATGTDADWVPFSVTGAVPTGAVIARVYAYSGTHTAGTVEVDGLSLRRYSSLSAPPAPASVSATITQDTAGHVYVSSSWTQPGSTGSAVGTVRFASFYADDTTTTPLNEEPSQINWNLGMGTLTAEDNFPGPESGCWIEIWVANLNGDLAPGPFAKSARYELQPGITLDGGAGDVTLDQSYEPKTWSGDVLTVALRYAPYYPGPSPSRLTPTLGAYCSLESGEVVTAAQDIPYTANSEADPPDNLTAFTLSISKAEIMAGTPDLSGNYTIYAHACAYEADARIGFKPYPLQATSATQAITVTAAELTAAVPLPDPVAPTSLTLTIDNASYPDFFIAKPDWAEGSGDLSGTDQYRLQWIFTNAASPAPNSSSTWIRDSVVYGATNTSYTSDPWPKDLDAPLYVWYRIRAERGALASSWVYLAAGVVANADSNTDRPAQPASGDFSLTIIGYSKDSADAASQVKLLFTVSNPQSADHTELRMWSGGIPSPVDLAKFEAIVKGSGSYPFWWPRVDAGETVYYTAVNCPSPNYRVSPAADNTWKTLAIPAVAAPGAVTGFSVTASAAYLINGQKHIDITYQFTPPAGTDHMEFHMDREGRTDATFTTLAGLPFGSYQYQVLNLPYVQRGVLCSEFNEYWRYKITSVDWLGRENPASTVYYNATFIKGDGVNSGALTNMGQGLGIVGGQQVATIVAWQNGDFSRGLLGWSTSGTVTSDSTQYDSPPSSAKLTGGSSRIWQDVTAVAGQTGVLQFKVKNLASAANVSVYIRALNNAGTAIASTLRSITPSAAWQGSALTLPLPTGTVSARAEVVLESGAGPLEAAYLDSVLLDFVTVGGGVSVNPTTGAQESSLVGSIKNQNFAYGLSDWYTSDTSALWPLLPLDGNYILNTNGNPGNCCQINALPATLVRQIVQDVPCIPGQTWRASASIYNGTNVTAYIAVAFKSATGAPISTSYSDTAISPGAAWQSPTNVKVAPAGAAWVRFKVYFLNATSGALYVDNCSLDSEPGVGSGMTRDTSGNLIPKIDNDLLVVDGSGNLTNNFLQTFARAADPSLFSYVGGKYTIVAGAVFANLVAAAVALITGTLQVGGGTTNIVVSPGSIQFNTPGGAVVTIGYGTLAMGSLSLNGNSITIGGDVSISPFAANFSGPVTGQSFSAAGNAGLTTSTVIGGVTHTWTGGILTGKA